MLLGAYMDIQTYGQMEGKTKSPPWEGVGDKESKEINWQTIIYSYRSSKVKIRSSKTSTINLTN